MSKPQEQLSLKANYYVTIGWTNESLGECSTMPVNKKKLTWKDFE